MSELCSHPSEDPSLFTAAAHQELTWVCPGPGVLTCQSSFTSVMAGEASIIPLLWIGKYKAREVKVTKQCG